MTWEELPALTTIAAALAPDAPRIHAHREDNVLVRGRVVRGDVEKALAESEVVVEDEYETGFVEHAYIEPEAGFARRVNDQIEIQACTQSPYMDRADIAKILGHSRPRRCALFRRRSAAASARSSICPSSRLWRSRPGICASPCGWFTRVESIISTTKRHPSSIRCAWARRETAN